MPKEENNFFTLNDKQKIKEILSKSKNNHKKIITQLEEIILEKSAKLKINSKKYRIL